MYFKKKCTVFKWYNAAYFHEIFMKIIPTQCLNSLSNKCTQNLMTVNNVFIVTRWQMFFEKCISSIDVGTKYDVYKKQTLKYLQNVNLEFQRIQVWRS